ncbi:MAG: hypothetical protein ACRDRI_19205 [Pseudonocardiaceae bacterium]
MSVDEPTVALLSKHRADSAQSLSLLGRALTDDTWLFSAQPDLSKPRDPSSVTRRYSRLARGLGINTQLKQLRHYSASGVPLQAQARELLASVVGAGAR